MQAYLKNLRQKVGHQRIIHPGARILVENKAGHFLFIHRTDNNQWGLPAGALEEGETIEDCIRREVTEETGLHLGNLTLIGISSAPARETVTYPNGDVVQYFTIEFYSNLWEGTPQSDFKESKAAGFYPVDTVALPANENHIFQSLAYYQKNGTPLLS
jgi:ADP-ribose pyrophosphatase YjhB (NUDIX family)